MQRLSRDRGAVTVLVAIVMPVVLLGMGALVLDAGQLYAERRQLQNGADAGALAVAREYARSLVPVCVPGLKAETANSYADSNANDAAGSNIDSVECPALTQVRVTTSTQSGDGGFLPPILRQVLGHGNATLTAKATAAWGAPAGLTGFPLTISQCEFDFYTTGGTVLQWPPPYPPWPIDFAIKFHNTSNPLTGCPTSSSGSDVPGGFGWLMPDPDAPAGSCVTATNDENWSEDKTGVSVPGTDCRNALAALVGKIVNLPVYDKVNGLNGANGEYHIASYVAFVLTGYKFPGENRASVATGQKYCVQNETCIYGFFTTNPTPTGGQVGDDDPQGVTVFGITE